ncbi:MAG: aldo/keto reductase, partial [Flavobacteriia bacterium]|nr:aldo/keto reductase [Flavobacteriia bacterium]
MKKCIAISETLTVPRLVIGLWQIADIERKNQQLDLNQTATYMDSYVHAGFTTFDMADHYGSSEIE